MTQRRRPRRPARRARRCFGRRSFLAGDSDCHYLK